MNTSSERVISTSVNSLNLSSLSEDEVIQIHGRAKCPRLQRKHTYIKDKILTTDCHFYVALLVTGKIKFVSYSDIFLLSYTCFALFIYAFLLSHTSHFLNRTLESDWSQTKKVYLRRVLSSIKAQPGRKN